jgi:hypothetical protein
MVVKWALFLRFKERNIIRKGQPSISHFFLGVVEYM